MKETRNLVKNSMETILLDVSLNQFLISEKEYLSFE